MSKLSAEMEFFIFLLERYTEHNQKTAPEILKIWDETSVGEWTLTEYIWEKYFIYHIESLTNAFSDIDHILQTGEALY